MNRKLAFTSFDFDHDEDLRNLLVGQARNPDSPFAIEDWSVKEPLTGDWKQKVRSRIRGADVVIVICGQYTHTASGVAEELMIAREEDKPYFLLKGRKNDICTKPQTALKSDEIQEWTWENLRKCIEGKNIVEAMIEWLNSPTPWLIAGGALALWHWNRKARERSFEQAMTRDSIFWQRKH